MQPKWDEDGFAREQVCRRGSAVLEGDLLTMHCSVHGEIGRIYAGGDEYRNLEAAFVEHVRRVRLWETSGE